MTDENDNTYTIIEAFRISHGVINIYILFDHFFYFCIVPIFYFNCDDKRAI